MVRAYLLIAMCYQGGERHRAARWPARPIPAGATYRIRGGEYWFVGARAFPSYLQAGPSYGIEKSKVAMIAEDIAAALRVAGLV